MLKLLCQVSAIIIVCSCILFLTETVKSFDNFKVYGRVVDHLGKPIANASIYLYPLPEQNEKAIPTDVFDSVILYLQSDSEGRFDFSQDIKRFAICATYPSDKEIFNLLPPNFLCISSNLKAFQTNKNENTFLGDIKVSYNYQDIELSLLDEKQHSLFKQKAPSTIWLRLGDDKYRRITTAKVPFDSNNKDISSVQLYLPEGKWNIEFSFEKHPKTWSTAVPLTVPNEHSSQRIKQYLLVKFQTRKNNFTPTVAKAKLKRLGIEYSLSSFINYVSDGNKEIVRLFLESGFDPNSLTKNNSTLLMYGVNFPDIIEMLLESGADVNQKTDQGITALMSAVIEGNVKSVDLLLQAGADVNAQNSEGKTALAFANEENEEEIITMLRQRGARKDIEN